MIKELTQNSKIIEVFKSIYLKVASWKYFYSWFESIISI
jgi:hypothetical protein